MANPEHLEILKQGVEVWNRWREENPDTQPDLKQAELSLNPVQINVSSNLINANLSGADLTGATLVGARLTGADLTGADLIGANLGSTYVPLEAHEYALVVGSILSIVPIFTART